MPAAIEAKALTKVYGKGAGQVRALDAVDFRVSAGEIFGLIGADGAGKTTAFKLMSGVMEPTKPSSEGRCGLRTMILVMSSRTSAGFRLLR